MHYRISSIPLKYSMKLNLPSFSECFVALQTPQKIQNMPSNVHYIISIALGLSVACFNSEICKKIRCCKEIARKSKINFLIFEDVKYTERNMH